MTNYRTGDEFHLDGLIAQYFSESFGVGINGCYYQLLTRDSGTLPLGINAANFKGFGVGLGPAVIVNVPIAGKPVSFIAKAIFDVDSSD